ncbi:hypothetical protein EXN66_Car020682 [Channa argus]|uniref:Ceramide kinase PH domain-containing protein n=1 Tax=Channa argus TaxID=215402 RepID=A0A6G1QQN1_CHAAH|nr:hypothetical protein EXN66_Car020682 [Channa argus]
MEKQPRLFSSKLVHKQNRVEVVLNSNILAWREIERSRKRGSAKNDTAEIGVNPSCVFTMETGGTLHLQDLDFSGSVEKDTNNARVRDYIHTHTAIVRI